MSQPAAPSHRPTSGVPAHREGACRRSAACVLLLIAAIGASCGGAPPAEAPPWEHASVEGLPWARVSQAQLDAAARLGVPVAFEGPQARRFVFVPAGPFTLGTPADERGHRADELPHEVRIGLGYYIQVEATPIDGPLDMDALRATAQALSAADEAWTYRLPTEAEWARAARAGTEGPYPTRDGRAPADGVSFVNAWGLRGVVGGRREVVGEPAVPYDDYPVADPRRLYEGGAVRLRGGSEEGRPVRVGRRRRAEPGAAASDLGYRLIAPLGYGLGHYGRYQVTFRFRDAAPEGVPADAEAVRLQVIRMENRLGERRLGRVPRWEALEPRARPLRLSMVPGRYYVFSERGTRGAPDHQRSLEVKFNVAEDRVVDVPWPIRDPKAEGSSSPQ